MRKTRSLEMRNRFRGIGVSMVMSVLTLAVLPSAGETKPQLCQGNYQSEAQAREQLAGFAQSPSYFDTTNPAPHTDGETRTGDTGVAGGGSYADSAPRNGEMIRLPM